MTRQTVFLAATAAVTAVTGVLHYATSSDVATFLVGLFALGVSDRLGDRASRHQVAISVVGAVVLLFIYAAWLANYLRSDVATEPALEEGAHHLPFTRALVLLAIAGVGAAFVSDWFVAAL